MARVHCLRANIERDHWKRIEILRLAVSFADPDRNQDVHQTTSTALAEALVDWVESAGILDKRDRSLLDEAARLYESVGDMESCGDVYARMGYHNKAAAAWTEAGAVEKLEGAYLIEEVASASQSQHHRHIDDFRMAESAGMFLDAKSAIDAGDRQAIL